MGTRPFDAVEREGAIYGRGAADSKANVLVHVGALRAWDGKPPVGIKLLIEGQEEVGSPLEGYPAKLGQFAADAMLDRGRRQLRPGAPSLDGRDPRRRLGDGRSPHPRQRKAQRLYGGIAPDARWP